MKMRDGTYNITDVGVSDASEGGERRRDYASEGRVGKIHEKGRMLEKSLSMSGQIGMLLRGMHPGGLLNNSRISFLKKLYFLGDFFVTTAISSVSFHT